MDPIPEERLLPLRVVHAADRPFLFVCQTLRKKSIQIGFPSQMFDIDADGSFGCYRDLNCVSGMRKVERNCLQKAAVRFDSGFLEVAVGEADRILSEGHPRPQNPRLQFLDAREEFQDLFVSVIC